MTQNNMKNFYYYSFYFLSFFIKAVNKRNNDYKFSGMAFLTMLMGINLFTIVSILFKYEIYSINPYIFSLIVAIPLLVLNYNFLYRNNKGKEIFSFYNKKWRLNKKEGMIYLFAFLLYIITTMFFGGYVAYLIKNHLM